MTGLLNPKSSVKQAIFVHDSRCVPRPWHGIFPSGILAVLFFSKSVFGRGLNPFTAGTLFRGTKLLGISIGRGLGDSKGFKLPN